MTLGDYMAVIKEIEREYGFYALESHSLFPKSLMDDEVTVVFFYEPRPTALFGIREWEWGELRFPARGWRYGFLPTPFDWLIRRRIVAKLAKGAGE